MGDKRRQDLRQVDTPSNTGTHVGNVGRRRDPRKRNTSTEDTPRQDLRKADATSTLAAHVGRQWETRGDKALGSGTRHPTEGSRKGDNGGQDLGKRAAFSNKGTLQERSATMEKTGVQDKGKPRREAREDKGGHTSEHRHA